MYRLNDDIPAFIDMLDMFIKESSNTYRESIMLLDISYFKTFSSNVISYLLSVDDTDDYKEKIESIFVDVCMSSILSTNKNVNIFELVEYAVDMLATVLEKSSINIEFNKTRIKDQIILYLDVLKNNVENVLDLHGFNSSNRISMQELDYLETYDKFYVVGDFNLGNGVNKIRNNSLLIKRYERIN